MSKVITASLAKRRIAKWDPSSDDLQFVDYTSIEPDAAKLIGEVKGLVDLRYVTDISDEVAENFASFVGSLDFAGLRTLSSNAAKALSSIDGWLHLEISEISNDVAAELAKGKVRVKLTKLRALDNCPGHIELAKKLARDGVTNRLYYLERVAKEVSDAVPELKK